MYENSIRRIRKHNFYIVILSLAAVALLLTSCGPPESKCAGPLDISKPVHAGTKVLAYEHGTAECPISIYANGALVPQAKGAKVSLVGNGKVVLNRALIKDEIITARQDPKGYPTWSKKAPKVEKIPSSLLINGEKFKSPSIVPPVVRCQLGVQVEKLVEGARVGVSGDPVVSPKRRAHGTDWSPFKKTFVGVGVELEEADNLVCMQDMESKNPQPSDYSAPAVVVQKLPKSLPKPKLKEDIGKDGVPDILVGSKVVTVSDLFVGAIVSVYSVDQNDKEKVVGGGIATAKSNWTPVEPLEKGLKYCARQSLCRLESEKDTVCVFPKNSINIPSIREPLCPDDIDVIVDKTVLGSAVNIRVNGDDKKGDASAQGSSTVVNISGGFPLKQTDKVAVKQSNAALDSGWGKDVVVKSKQECEAIKRPKDTTPPPPPTQPICKPGKSTVKLFRDESQCQAGLVHAYTGSIPSIQNGSLFSVTNNTSLWRVKIVDSHNLKGQSGDVSCKTYGARCVNVTPVAILNPGDSWSNIKNPTLKGGRNLYTCLEPITNTPFPMTVDIEYEYKCL